MKPGFTDVLSPAAYHLYIPHCSDETPTSDKNKNLSVSFDNNRQEADLSTREATKKNCKNCSEPLIAFCFFQTEGPLTQDITSIQER